jgi:HK97 gp10 family phage protein
MALRVKTEGFADLEREMQKLANPTARKNSARRAMVKAVAPMMQTAQQLAPRRKGHMADSIAIGNSAAGRAAGKAAYAASLQAGGTRDAAVQAMRDAQRETASQAAIVMGPGRHPQAFTQEFGTRHHAAQPFMRPAWDAESAPTLDRIKVELWADLQKTIARAEKAAARKAARES